MRRREGAQHRLDPRSSNNDPAADGERHQANRSLERLERQLREARPVVFSSPPRHPRAPPKNDSRRRSRSRPLPRDCSRRHENRAERSCPFDADGYCVTHPDVRMAKRNGGGRGWRIKLEKCPKCHFNNQTSNLRMSGDTESMTSEGSWGRDYHRHHNVSNYASNGRGRAAGSGGQSKGARSRSSARDCLQPGGRPTYERHRSRSDENNRRDSRRSTPDRRANRERDARSGSGPPGRGGRGREGRRSAGPPSVVSRGSSSLRSLRRSLSRSSRRSGGSRQRPRRRPPKMSDHHVIGVRQRPRGAVCVDGAPFDKGGRCFVHPHVKLASKRMLGGWKIHMEFCPLCLRDDDDDDRRRTMEGDQGSVVSGMSRLTDGSGFSGLDSSRRSAGHSGIDSSYRSSASRGRSPSLASVGSARSNASTNTWSTNRSSRKRAKKKDDSFLPLDEDGFCLRHPDVQLAKMSKKGGLKILMDFCPECAGDSLVGGGRARGRRGGSPSVASVNSSGRSSVRSGRSDGSHSFIERMPYIDGDGRPGHYTGHVDRVGQPTGRGEMRYIDGSRFDGAWHEGTKVHGRTSRKLGGARPPPKPRTLDRQDTQNITPAPPPPPPLPPPLLPKKMLPGSRQKGRERPGDNAEGERKSSGQQRSRRDVPPRSPVEAKSGAASSVGRPSRSLSRLRRKCDEIESLLRGCPSSKNSD